MSAIACEHFVGQDDAWHASAVRKALVFVSDAIALIESGRVQEGVELLRRCQFETDNTLTWVINGAPFPRSLMRYPPPEPEAKQ